MWVVLSRAERPPETLKQLTLFGVMKRFLLLTIALFVAQGVMSQALSPETLAKRAKRKNLTVKEWNTDSSKKSRWLDHLTVYDSLGRKIEEVEYNQFGQIERVTCEYDPKTDMIIREVVYDHRNKPQRIRKYEYNEDGTKHKQYNYLPNGKLYTIKIFEYVFED